MPDKLPLRASAAALQAKPSVSTSAPSPSSTAAAAAAAAANAVQAALEAEVAALRAQLSDQAEGHQSDMSALRAEQALRRAALEEALRAEAAESEKRLCLQFAEEATAFKVQADISLQKAEARTRAAARREMSVLRMELEGKCGVILVCGPPCAGKTTRVEALGACLGIPHASLLSLMVDAGLVNAATEAAYGVGAAAAEEDDELTALCAGGMPSAERSTASHHHPSHQSSPPPPPMSVASIVQLLVGAARCASDSLLLLECPTHSVLLPSLLLALTPELVLLIDAPDHVCARRLRRRAHASTPRSELSDAHISADLDAYRATDERFARALGKRLPGRLCVIDDRVSADEASAIFVEAIVQSTRAPTWAGALSDVTRPPIVIVGTEAKQPSVSSASAAALSATSGAVVGDAAVLADAMATGWDLAVFHVQAEGDDAAADATASAVVRAMAAELDRWCVLSATPASLPVAIRALQRYDQGRTAASSSAEGHEGPASSGPVPPPASPPFGVGTAPPTTALCTAFVLTSGERHASSAADHGLERARSVLTSVSLPWDALPCSADTTAHDRRGGGGEGGGNGGNVEASATPGWVDAAMTHAAELLVARALQLPPLQPLVRGGSSSSKGSVALDADWRSSGDGCRVQAAPPAQTSLASQSRRQGKQSVSPLELQLPAKLPPEGLNPTYLAGSALRGIVVVSGAEDGRKQRSAQAAAGGASSSSNSSSCSGSVAGGGDRDGGGGGGGDGGGSGGISCAMAEGADGKIQSEMEASSLCETLAERLGAAHVALPRLLRGQLEALQQMTGSKSARAEQSSLLADTLREGKLISASSTLRAVQTALHAAPEGLILIEHSGVDSPLEALCSSIRPSLVLLVRPKVEANGASAGGGWASARHDADARQAYERRALEVSLGADAPQVRLTSGDCTEACELIYDFLCSEAWGSPRLQRRVRTGGAAAKHLRDHRPG